MIRCTVTVHTCMLCRRLKKEAKRKRKLAAESAAGMPELDMEAYGYAKDDDPDNPANYHAPDEDTPFGQIARGEQVNDGLIEEIRD